MLLMSHGSFNATLMLETLRGKRMLFVGDSLNRGQYVSMVCLLHRFIPENAKSMKTVGNFDVFTIKVIISSKNLNLLITIMFISTLIIIIFYFILGL